MLITNIIVILIGVAIGTVSSTIGYGCDTWQYWLFLLGGYAMFLLGCYKGLKDRD